MKPIDVKETMREIRARIRDRNPRHLFLQQNSSSTLSTSQEPDWTRLQEANTALEAGHSRVGVLPHVPPTLRGRVGGFLVRVIRRALFWYTPQIISFHGIVVRSFKALTAAIETVATTGQQSRMALEAVDRQVAELRTEGQGLEKIFQTRLDETNRQLGQFIEALREETRKREEISRRLSESESCLAHYREHDDLLVKLRADVISQSGRISMLLEEVRKRAPDSFE
jgi:hypothetical protein